MIINLSEETISTVCNSLKSTKHSLERQLEAKVITPNKKAIITHQLEEVEDALMVFEELMESL